MIKRLVLIVGLSTALLVGCSDEGLKESLDHVEGEVVSIQVMERCCAWNKLTIKLDGGEAITFHTGDSSRWDLLMVGQRIKIYHSPDYFAKTYEQVVKTN